MASKKGSKKLTGLIDYADQPHRSKAQIQIILSHVINNAPADSANRLLVQAFCKHARDLPIGHTCHSTDTWQTQQPTWQHITEDLLACHQDPSHGILHNAATSVEISSASVVQQVVSSLAGSGRGRLFSVELDMTEKGLLACGPAVPDKLKKPGRIFEPSAMTSILSPHFGFTNLHTDLYTKGFTMTGVIGGLKVLCSFYPSKQNLSIYRKWSGSMEEADREENGDKLSVAGVKKTIKAMEEFEKGQVVLIGPQDDTVLEPLFIHTVLTLGNSVISGMPFIDTSTKSRTRNIEVLGDLLDIMETDVKNADEEARKDMVDQSQAIIKDIRERWRMTRGDQALNKVEQQDYKPVVARINQLIKTARK